MFIHSLLRPLPQAKFACGNSHPFGFGEPFVISLGIAVWGKYRILMAEDVLIAGVSMILSKGRSILPFHCVDTATGRHGSAMDGGGEVIN